ncbi:hypothetical protein ASPWEDRAFT_167993 [Aspergillus wentii DTO 134E9]|uniref:Rhodopsin domain-containing protein n=1 Tax=Aspergillus wentii DTO 134E9 TaxID=1073089 RepID=A0A1L9RT10_ASPWE|nr:uncharacterized protein ASPWEDRAFT_167993 [Aspergillus wentii DTO 134E9]KAI9933721.1 hypothetical protein MW887_004792 [Aspergillus wentii]OJJ38060.1 hypothetical protein ASPWEDRAFT_167993 [Aspergillus wentii DTO 134E9]
MKTYSLDVPLARNPVIAVTFFGALATLMTGLRLYALRLRQTKPGAPEWLIIAALFIVYCDIAIEYVLTIVGGAGRHASTIDPSSVVITLKTILPLEALYGIVMGLIKTSIMLFVTRIFGTKRNFKISVAVTMAIVWMWAISVILETFLLCRPLALNWDMTVPGKCGNRNAAYVVAGILNLITDLMVMALPLPHIWKLQLNIAKKIALCSVFCMGLLVSVISIIRLKALMDIDFNDITHSVQLGVMWTVLEPELAIICANMPLMKVILSRAMPTIFSSQRKYAISDPQAFERLDEHSGGAYPLNRMNQAEASGGGPARKKGKSDLLVSMQTMDEEWGNSSQQHLPSRADGNVHGS